MKKTTKFSYREVLAVHSQYKKEIKTVRGGLKSFVAILDGDKNNQLVTLATTILRGSGENFQKFSSTVRKNNAGMTCVFWVEQALFKEAKQASKK